MPSLRPSTNASSGSQSCSLRLNWLRAFLAQRVRLQRRGLQIHVLLDPAPVVEVAATAPRAGRGEALRRDHQALRALLDRHADSRYTMRHLAYVEQALANSGSRAIQDTPPRVLREALAQLQSLLLDGDEKALPELRARLVRAVEKRVRAGVELDAPTPVFVSEASHSLFDEMERSWAGEIPMSPSASASAPKPAAAPM